MHNSLPRELLATLPKTALITMAKNADEFRTWESEQVNRFYNIIKEIANLFELENWECDTIVNDIRLSIDHIKNNA